MQFKIMRECNDNRTTTSVNLMEVVNYIIFVDIVEVHHENFTLEFTHFLPS